MMWIYVSIVWNKMILRFIDIEFQGQRIHFHFCANDKSNITEKGDRLHIFAISFKVSFLAATKQLYEWFSPSVCPSVRLSVCPSVRLSHLFDYVPIILSSWNFQELLPVTKVTSMQKVKVRGQRSRSQRSRPKFSFPDCNSSLNSHMMMKWYI